MSLRQKVVLMALLTLFISNSAAATGGGPGQTYLPGMVVPGMVAPGMGVADSGTITGQVIMKNKAPLANGSLLLYDKALGPPPRIEEYLRIPNSIEAIDKEGRFTIKAKPGTYYLCALKWSPKSKEAGPPRDGDPIFFLVDDQGRLREVSVEKGRTEDVGIIRQSDIFDSKKQRFGKGITAIEGTVTDIDGKPVEGVIVTGSVDGNKVYASYKTRKDGKFIMRTQDGGTFSLQVMDRYGGGRPAVGEPFYCTDASQPEVLVTVKKGEKVAGAKLIAKKFIGQGPPEEKR